jgi:UrcA family protein
MSHFVIPGSAGSRARLALALLGGLAGVVSMGAAGAVTTNDQVPKVVVRYSEQSLASDAGVNELYRRIVQASKQVCPDDAVRDLASRQLAQVCRQEAVARAIQQIHNSQLAALYASHSKNG